MPRRFLCSRIAGFTFVEMVIVISILGVLAIGSMRFLTDASTGFVQSNERALLASDAQTTIDLLAREVRGALPNSLRATADGQCFEFIPTLRALSYLSVPLGLPGSQLWSVPVPGFVLGADTRVALGTSLNPYQLGSVAMVSGLVSNTTVLPDGRMQIDLSAPHQFASASASERAYFVEDPVSVCVDGGALYRYASYGYLPVQPNAADLPATLPNRELIAESITSPGPVFGIGSPSLQRNGLISVSLTFASESANNAIGITQHLHVRNLP